MQRGLVIAAPTSGAGKTTVTLGLLRALSRRGFDVRAAKSGPDYIDPAFHAVACGNPSVNLDAWAMPGDALRSRAKAQGGEILIIEGAMGVLDAGRDDRGSVAELAETLGIPLVLVLDIARSGQSAVLPVAGLQTLWPHLRVSGAILNRAGSESHATIAAKALEAAGTRLFGWLKRESQLALPERHLGLVQAGETEALETFLDTLADRIEAAVELDALFAAAAPLESPAANHPTLPPFGQRIAVASDVAFAFAYPHLLDDWRNAGAEILPFSPLADEAPDPRADCIFLPGGYPELHAGRLAASGTFKQAMQDAGSSEIKIYGECGGYMALGHGLIDAEGQRHKMLGLLPLETSFQKRRLTLGYRRLTPLAGAPWTSPLLGHEFHYATITRQDDAPALFSASDAVGVSQPEMGLRIGNVTGSFAHVIGPDWT